MDDDKSRVRDDLSRGDAGGERASSNDVGTLEQRVVAALRTIYDPEIPVNIYDLGLVYELRVDAGGVVKIRMTLTTPGCPVAQIFPGMVEEAVGRVPSVSEARVELVWEPPWSRDRLSEAARLELGML